MASEPIVRLEDVSFEYPGRGATGFAMRIHELSIGSGEHVACIGASGCGKTTLINLIAGILTPARGRIVADGVEVSGLSDAQRRRFRLERIGIVFQEFDLIEYMS